MKTEYDGYTIEVTANRCDMRWMAVVLINPAAKNSSSRVLQTSIATWGHKSQAEAEKAGLESAKQRINLYILRVL